MSESKVATWRARVAEWRASGESADAFSARQGLVANTLRWWARRLEHKYGDPPSVATDIEPAQQAPRRTRAKRVDVRMARVVKVPTPTPSVAPARRGMIAIELLDARARITIEIGVDQQTLRTVLAVVAARDKR